MTKVKKEANGKLKAEKGFFDWKALVFVLLLVVIPTAQFCIFYIGTNVNSFSLAFKEYNLGKFEWIGGFDNFVSVFEDIAKDELIKTSFINSFIVYGVGLIVNIPLVILFTYYIFKKYIGHKLFKVLLYLPNILSVFTLCTIFRTFTEDAVRIAINDKLGTELEPFFSAGIGETYAMLMFVYIFFGLGTSMLMYLGAMSGLNDSVLEAAKIDGVSSFGELWHIILPMIYPTIKTFLIVGLAGIFANQFNLFNFYAADAKSNFSTIGYYFYVHIADTSRFGKPWYPYIAAFGLVISLVLIPIAIFLNKWLEKFDKVTD